MQYKHAIQELTSVRPHCHQNSRRFGGAHVQWIPSGIIVIQLEGNVTYMRFFFLFFKKDMSSIELKNRKHINSSRPHLFLTAFWAIISVKSPCVFDGLRRQTIMRLCLKRKTPHRFISGCIIIGARNGQKYICIK